MSDPKSAPISAIASRSGRFRQSESSTRNSGWYNLCRIHVGIHNLRTGPFVGVSSQFHCSQHSSWHRPKQPFLSQPQRQRQALLLRANKYTRDEGLEAESYYWCCWIVVAAGCWLHHHYYNFIRELLLFYWIKSTKYLLIIIIVLFPRSSSSSQHLLSL